MDIIPAVLAQSIQDFEQKISSPLMQVVPYIHIDVMDGSFTTQSCISHPGLIPDAFSPLIELHLMVNDPLPYLEEWVTQPRFKRAIIHIEAPCDHARAILFNSAHGKETGFAISPSTPLHVLAPLAEEVHRFLVMGIEPGASGQQFLGSPILERITALRNLYPHHHISLDGGMNTSTIPLVKESGSHSACTASAVWNSEFDAITAYKRLTYI